MAEKQGKHRSDKELRAFCSKETVDVSDSAELRELRSSCSSTVRIPLNEADVVEMEEVDFIKYISSTIKTAHDLVLKVLEKCEDSHIHVAEWSQELTIDNQNFDIKDVSDYVADRITQIETLAFLCSSRQTAREFSPARNILQEAHDKLMQRRRAMR